MRAGLSLSLSLLAAVAVAWGVAARERELRSPRDLHRTPYAQSHECTRCHADHAASFARTFHRTMTQEAHGDAVRAPFAGESLRYFGVGATMSRTADGTPQMTFGGGAVPVRSFEIALTVGSRRYQQYIGRVGDALYRLPWAYHLEEQRWFHMNGAFLTADPEPDAQGVSEADYTRHMTRWNDNCVFCHNVHPSPGLGGSASSPRFDTRVAELGVACEACHGPASEHARANVDPYRRYRLHLGDHADPTIVNPARLSQERALDVCGRCHGQRITDDVSNFLREGDPFVPGDDLALYSAPLWRDTALAGEVGGFAPRFWQDGTPRLTAYEYQGTLLSACTHGGVLTCSSCHDMHAGDPRGQLRPDLPGDRLCTQCHDVIAAKPAAHSKHDDVPCVGCHMPKIVYGVMASHPSHRIERPDPARDARLERPDACTLCHLERTRAWAIEATARLWPSNTRGSEAEPESGFSQAETQLIAADPVTRALTAAAYGERPATPRTNALLLDVLAHDRYPGVRHLAYRSLRAQHALTVPYEPEWTAPERTRAVAELSKLLAHDTLDERALAGLRARADDAAIDIGE